MGQRIEMLNAKLISLRAALESRTWATVIQLGQTLIPDGRAM